MRTSPTFGGMTPPMPPVEMPMQWSLTVRVVADSFAGGGRAGAGRQALGAGRDRAEGRRAGRRQRQRGQRRDRDAEDAADRVAGGRGRRGADESRRR